MSDFSFIPPASVVTIPSANASAAFTSQMFDVYKKEHNSVFVFIKDRMINSSSV